jgi:hypothetical protein
MVADHQPNSQTAKAVSDFLLWCISPEGGNASTFLDPLHFMALPTSIRARSEAVKDLLKFASGSVRQRSRHSASAALESALPQNLRLFLGL